MAQQPPDKLTHLNERGEARMVDVGAKEVTRRVARAEAFIWMKPATREAIRAGSTSKGDVFSTARIAAIMAAKRTAETIPMCHPLAIDFASVEFEFPEAAHSAGREAIRVLTEVRVSGRTGVEMEALHSAAVAALTIYDMAKALEKSMLISGLRLLSKSGGKSGDYVAKG